MINQGLLKLDARVDVSDDCYSMGEIILHRSNNIIESCKKCDFIFCGKIGAHERWFDEFDLWGKVIWYDFEDHVTYNKDIANKCLGYFKRSTFDKKRQQIDMNGDGRKIHQIDYCVLDEYLGYKNDIIYDVACLFGDDSRLCRKRLNLKTEVVKMNFKNSFVGTTCSNEEYGSIARNSLKYPRYDNCFVKYLEVLNSSKIILTAFPTNHDGDSRLWEALASKSLVFSDIPYIKNEFDLVDGKHLFFYDASNIDNINRMLTTVSETIRDINLVKKMALDSYEYVMEYHRPINRIIYMFKSIGLF